jgi:hypothetical protein
MQKQCFSYVCLLNVHSYLVTQSLLIPLHQPAFRSSVQLSWSWRVAFLRAIQLAQSRGDGLTA